VEPEVVVVVVVVGGAGVTAATVVVWDNVTVGVDFVGVVTVGVDCVGMVAEGAVRVGVVRVSEFVSVPTAEPLPPPHAVRSPAANTASIAAAASRFIGSRRAITHERSHSGPADTSSDRDDAHDGESGPNQTMHE
jgi:hypothetical protein